MIFDSLATDFWPLQTYHVTVHDMRDRLCYNHEIYEQHEKAIESAFRVLRIFRGDLLPRADKKRNENLFEQKETEKTEFQLEASD